MGTCYSTKVIEITDVNKVTKSTGKNIIVQLPNEENYRESIQNQIEQNRIRCDELNHQINISCTKFIIKGEQVKIYNNITNTWMNALMYVVIDNNNKHDSYLLCKPDFTFGTIITAKSKKEQYVEYKRVFENIKKILFILN
jgi:hypothetical protein